MRQLLTTADVAETYGINKHMQKRLREGRQIPYVKLGHRSVMYRPADILAFIEARYVPAGGAA